jgi:hypothetical protein
MSVFASQIEAPLVRMARQNCETILILFYFSLYAVHFCSVFTNNQQTHFLTVCYYTPQLQYVSTHARHQEAFLCLLSCIKACANLWYPLVVFDTTLKYKSPRGTAPQMYILPSETAHFNTTM